MVTLKNEIEKDHLVNIYVSVSLIGVSLFVIIGWIFHVSILTNVYSEWVTMKFSTAFNFFLCGIMVSLYRNEYARVFISGMIFSVVVSTLVAHFFEFSTSGFFPSLEKVPGRYTVIADFPSWTTLACFSLISVFTFFNRKVQHWFAVVITGISTLAIVGYVANLPLLYYFIPGFSTAMAFHTAVLLLHMGLFLKGLSKHEP